MTDKELNSEGFTAVTATPDQIPVDAKFRVFCEENRCGKYNANYSCHRILFRLQRLFIM